MIGFRLTTAHLKVITLIIQFILEQHFMQVVQLIQECLFGKLNARSSLRDDAYHEIKEAESLRLR